MKINTQVKEVQIYRNRCTVIRSGTIPLKAGRNIVEISGMSSSAMIDTVRMSFPSVVKTGMIRVIEGKRGPKTQELSGKIRRIELRKKALKEQAEMWKPEGWSRIIRDMSVKDMEACIKAYPWRMEQTENKILALDNERTLLEQRLRKAVDEETRPLIQAELISESDTQCPFEMSYQDGNAGWNPAFEIHTDGVNNDVRFVMKANVYQNTSEDWNQVKLSVHTGNPVFVHSLPKLDPVYVTFRSDETRIADPDTMRMPVIENTFGNWGDDTMPGSPFGLRALNLNFVQTPGSNTADGYAIDDLCTVMSGYGDGFSCTVCEYTVHAEYVLKAVPKRDCNVYLCAQLKREDIPVKLDGLADVYLGGIYTANVYVDLYADDGLMTIPLGVTDRISLRREEGKKKTSDTVSGNQKSSVFEIGISAANHEDRDISLEIKDQIPVADSMEILVELLDSDHAEYDSTDGTLRWKLDLKSRQAKTVHAQYRVLRPKDREIEIPEKSRIVIEY
jgi:uncharacterized protein (TIGR02231 family)